MDLEFSPTVAAASVVYIDLEKAIFHKDESFISHKLDLDELMKRFNTMIHDLNEVDPEHKKNRILMTRLIDVKSTVEEDLFKWSYYNHKFASSKGKDIEAMNEWHKLEDSIEVDRIAAFKSLRETNQAFLAEIINNHKHFDQISIAKIDSIIKEQSKFGFDIAEEAYLQKTIEENNAEATVKLVNYTHASALLSLVRRIIRSQNIFSIKGHIISNSKRLDNSILTYCREIFDHLYINEVDLEDTDFVLLINDLDLFSAIPYIDTDKPIFTIDLSKASSPNFGYLLLKDEGFDQVYSFAKQRRNEVTYQPIIRSLTAGVLSLLRKEKFIEQLAINYMDDYFFPLSRSLNKPIQEFAAAINMLAEKLDSEDS